MKVFNFLTAVFLALTIQSANSTMPSFEAMTPLQRHMAYFAKESGQIKCKNIYKGLKGLGLPKIQAGIGAAAIFFGLGGAPGKKIGLEQVVSWPLGGPTLFGPGEALLEDEFNRAWESFSEGETDKHMTPDGFRLMLRHYSSDWTSYFTRAEYIKADPIPQLLQALDAKDGFSKEKLLSFYNGTILFERMGKAYPPSQLVGGKS